MKKLFSVLLRIAQIVLALKDLPIVLSSNAVVIYYQGSDGERFFVAKYLGKEHPIETRNAKYYPIKLSRVQIPDARLIYRKLADKSEFYFKIENREKRIYAKIVRLTFRSWLAILWRATFLLVL